MKPVKLEGSNNVVLRFFGDAFGKPICLEDGCVCTDCSYNRNEIFAVCGSSEDPAPAVPPMEQENVNRPVHQYFSPMPEYTGPARLLVRRSL
jgi:hypothetical protein